MMNELQQQAYKLTVARVLERQSKYTVKLWRDDMPEVYKLAPPVVMGDYSLFQMKENVRHLWQPKCIPLNVVNDDGEIVNTIYETPGSIARDYLIVSFGDSPMMNSEQWSNAKQPVQVPLYAVPSTFTNGYYIDIKSAWWSILKVVGWNCDYQPSRWLAQGKLPLDFPFSEHKVCRSALISVALGSRINIAYCDAETHDDEEHFCTCRAVMEQKSHSAIFHPMLFRLVCDVLHSMANEAIEAGALYVNNDGWIAPCTKIANRCIDIVKEWGLSATVKAEGKGAIFGCGSYMVGGSRTTRLIKPTPISGVYQLKYRKWLKQQFSVCASRSQKIWSEYDV